MDACEPRLQILAGELGKKVERAEGPVVGRLFARWEPVQRKFWLFRARKYSVSKLAIGLSDYVFVLWVSLVVAEFLKRYFHRFATAYEGYGLGAFVVYSALYLVFLFVLGRTSLPSRPTRASERRSTDEWMQ